MSLWQIAARNIWQNRGRYVAYLASAAFAVMIFFLYSALIYHPDLQGDYRGAGYVSEGMEAAAVVIAIFSFLFLLYSNAAFVRYRMKEFGLLSLLGISKGQLAGIILWESLMIAVVALTGGLSLGLLFLKLFFMAVSALVQLPEQIPLYAGPRVWALTIGVFGGFFLLVSLASLRSVLNKNIVDMVRAGRQPKGAPAFSRVMAVFGLVVVLGGYLWAAFPNPLVVLVGIMPVTTMVSVGTYVLMKEGSIAFLTWLHRRERYFYRPGPFLNVSQLVYKMQDNYRVLSAVAILIAVILTAVGTVASLLVVFTDDALSLYPRAVQLVQTGEADPASVRGVAAVLEHHEVPARAHSTLVTRTARLEQGEKTVHLVPYAFYAAAPRASGQTIALNGPDEAVLVWHGTVPLGYRKGVPTVVDTLLLDGQSIPLHVTSDFSGRVLNKVPPMDGLNFSLVVPDALFAELTAGTPAAERIQVDLWDGVNWKSRPMQRALADLRSLYPGASEAVDVSSPLEVYRESVKSMGFALFVGVFVSLVFFAACFSLLYSRLFTEVDDDRRYFRRLQQLGLNDRELKRLAVNQAAVIFFVPFAGGLLHSTFAMKALGTIANRTVLQYGWLVAVAYLVLYVLCFSATGSFYWKSLRAGLAGRSDSAA